eukprot:g11932.t1
MSISPQQTRTGRGTDLKNDAQLRRTADDMDRFLRPTDRAAEQNFLAELSTPKYRQDPRLRSSAESSRNRNDGGEHQSSAVFSTINAEGGAALETPSDRRAAETAAALVGKPQQQQQQQQRRQSSFGVAGAAATSVDDLVPTSREPPSSASPASAEDEEAVLELVGMGFDREHVVRALQACGRGESWKEAAISLLLEPQTSMAPDSGLNDRGRPETAGQKLSDPPTGGSSACPICLSEIEGGEVFTVDCKDQHVFCVTCLHRHCSVQLLDAGLIPACPLSNTCSHELSQEEVERVFLLRAYSANDGNGSNAEAARVEQEQNRRALETCGTLLTRRGLQSTGAVPCVSPECGNWMVPTRMGDGQRVTCGTCLIEFCGSCKRAPFHYTATCDEVVAIGRAWSAWLTEGKATFLKAMAAQDNEHKALLDQHNRRKQQHELAVKEAERLRLEYDRMEDWKESRCRSCPKCGRVVEKLSGCDLMVCGVDAHGGNVQNGCGVKFLWSRAHPYKGDRGERKTTPFTEQQPEAAARSRHFIAEGIPLRCDRCHRDVVGPLFRCVHCPSFACCLECQDMACRDPKHAHHIFQLIDGSPPLAAT